MNEEKTWDYLTKTIKDSFIARKVFNYITRYCGKASYAEIEKAYSKGYYEGLQIKTKPGKLSDQK